MITDLRTGKVTNFYTILKVALIIALLLYRDKVINKFSNQITFGILSRHTLYYGKNGTLWKKCLFENW